MAYYITSAGFEIDYADFKDASLTFYLYHFGLGDYIIAFLYEQMDLYCITIMDNDDMDYFNMNEAEKNYLRELKDVLNFS